MARSPLLTADAPHLAHAVAAGAGGARDEARRRYRPLADVMALRFCRKLGHRGARCSGWSGRAVCDRAFLPSSDRILDLVCGTDRRRGQFEVWAGHTHTAPVFEHWLRGRTGGWESESLRAWNAARGLKQRIRVHGEPRAALERHLAAFSQHHPAAHRADEAGLEVRASLDVWLQALFWDACQTGLDVPIDAPRVWRYLRSRAACADADLDTIPAGPAAFAALAGAVDDVVAASHPRLHHDYLEVPRSMTRTWLPFDEGTAR